MYGNPHLYTVYCIWRLNLLAVLTHLCRINTTPVLHRRRHLCRVHERPQPSAKPLSPDVARWRHAGFQRSLSASAKLSNRPRQVKHKACMRSVGGMLISRVPQAESPKVDKPQKSVTHGQCDVRPAVTVPAAGHHRPLSSIPNYTVWILKHMCANNLPKVVT